MVAFICRSLRRFDRTAHERYGTALAAWSLILGQQSAELWLDANRNSH